MPIVMHRPGYLLSALAATLLVYAAPVAAKQCTRVIQNEGSEYILNSCEACRKVNIRRKRRGIAMPVMRTYNIQPRSSFQTSFKGAGRSRISSEVPCEGADGAGSNIAGTRPLQPVSKKCVALKVTKTKIVVLVNKCAICRGAAIERFDSIGKSLGQHVYKMGPLSVKPIAARGANQVRYITDVRCSP